MLSTIVELPEYLTLDTLADLDAKISGAEGVVVLKGAGSGVFCRGLDVASTRGVSPEEKRVGLTHFEHSILQLLRGNAAIALVDGDALGGGLGLACACDVVIGTSVTRIGLPEPLFGLIPGMITPVLKTRMTGPTIRRLAISGATVGIDAVRETGLLDEVVESEALEGAARRWLRQFSRSYPPAVRRLKTWLAEMDEVEAQIKAGADHLAELLEDPEVTRRATRYANGDTPWGDD